MGGVAVPAGLQIMTEQVCSLEATDKGKKVGEGVMIKNWSEIQERYNAIKDHKPRASKKLNELGDILSSAYAINPDEADRMWQYIIDLNVADDIAFSKFYIAQVFNKLTDRMKPEDATEFLGMNPERLQMMIMYGYDGGTLWRCLDTLIQGYISSGDVAGAMVCVGYFYDKFGGINSGYTDISTVVGNVARKCVDHIKRNDNGEVAAKLLTKLGQSENGDINTYIDIVKAINRVGGPFDYEELLDAAMENRHPTEFFDLLWAAREEMDIEDLRDKWVDYVQDCSDDEVRPYNYINEDEDDYNKSRLKFYVDLENDTDELLEYYFNRATLYDVEKGVIWVWIETEEWDRFTKYLAQTVMCTPEESFDWSSVKRELEEYMKASFYEDYMDSTDHYGRSYKDLMREHGDDFADALSRISAITVGCEAHDSFHEFIKNFIQKQSGNLEALKSVGFDDEVETRSAEERLKEYVHDFLSSGKSVYERRTTKYSLIQDAMREELRDLRGGNSLTITVNLSGMVAKALGVELEDSAEEDEPEEEMEIDQELERDYRLAQDDEIAEFYFQHFPQECIKRQELISACVRKGDVGRAIELIDMMAETKGNEGYEELNGWGRQNMLTLMDLIDEYEYDNEDRWGTKKDITDEMREVVQQLVYRMMPYLPPIAAAELKEKSLYKIDPQSEDTDGYITQLLEDADVYTSFPKPRGKGGAPNINRMTDEFIHCFERLSKMGRLDVVAEIMGKFAAVRDILKPVTFDRWMSFMADGLQTGDMIKVFRQNREIFETWLTGDNLRDWDILKVARGIADGCTRAEFTGFRNLVISHRGKVAGLDACYQATSENTETQEMFDGETAKISLDYINIGGSSEVSFMEINLLTTAKTRKLDSVRLLKCEINGKGTTDCGFISEMDEEPKIGYNIFHVNEESQDELNIYSEFFEENSIDEISKIVLQFVIMDEDADVIEEMSDVVIEMDDVTGEYKVTQKAESLNCFIDIEEEEEEDDGDSDGSSIDLSGVLQLLQEISSSDGDEQVDEDTTKSDSDNFSDITIYEDDQGVLIDFCGIEFEEDNETITLSIWCRNHTDERRKLWLGNLKIDGENHGFIQFLGTIEANDSNYYYCEISNIAYSEIYTIDFEVELDDTENTELGRTRHVSLEVDTDNETFKVRVTGSAVYSNPYDKEEDEEIELEEDDGEEFEDITIYDEDDVHVDFCGAEFDSVDKVITLSIWCDNSSEVTRRFWITDVKVNGISHGTIEKLGNLDDYESEYFEFAIENVDGIPYEIIQSVEFSVEVDDSDNNELGRSQIIRISIDTDDESFQVSNIENRSYSDSYCKEGAEEIEIEEDDDDEEELLSRIDSQLKNLVQADIKTETPQDGQADIMDSLQEQINKLLEN